MALSNSQYDELMRTYEQRQLDNEHALRKRYETACSMIPELPALDNAISSSSIKQARLLLDGHEDALSELKKEISRLSAQKQALLCSHGFPEDYLDLLYTQSNLQEILEKENFSTFSLDYYSSNHKDPLTGRSSLEAIQTALHICHEFVDTFSEDFRNILLYGDTGVGKTFLSHCIAKEVMDSSYSVIYFSASRLFDVLAKNMFGKKDEETDDSLDYIYNCDLLIIDDLGTELANTFTTSQLFSCLNERILRRKSTIISTNLALDDIKTIYSERIFSRISSHYTMLRLTGDDIRIQKKLLNLGGTNDVTP